MRDEDLPRLAQRTDLTDLDLQSSEITDDGLARLEDMTSLTRLHLGDSQVTAAGLRHLASLTNLTDLDLSGSQVVLEDAVEHLKKLTGLRWLDLRRLRGRSVATYVEAIDELRNSLPHVSFHQGGLRPYWVTEQGEDESAVIMIRGQCYGESSGLSYLLWGIRRCGVIDEVPGFFFVATEFLHILRMPLLPLNTYLYQKAGNCDHGFAIQLSFKSLLFGWARGLLGLAAVVAVLVVVEGVVFSSDQPGFFVRAIVALIAILACGGLYVLTKIAARPTPERAEQLARALRLRPDKTREIREIVKTGRWSGELPVSELVHCAKCNREIAATTRVCPRCETRQF